MKCSVCSTEIEKNYCPTCGQHYRAKRASVWTILEDLFGNLFSLEKSFFLNIRTAICNPQTLITNYWRGFRGYYYGPGKFVAIASVFVLIHFLLSDRFLGIAFKSNLSIQFAFLFSIVVLISVSGYSVYYRQKKNFTEHLIANAYTVSLWSVIFVPLSVLLNLIEIPTGVRQMFFLVFILLILIWDSRIFEMRPLRRLAYVLVHFIVLAAVIALLIYFFGSFD